MSETAASEAIEVLRMTRTGEGEQVVLPYVYSGDAGSTAYKPRRRAACHHHQMLGRHRSGGPAPPGPDRLKDVADDCPDDVGGELWLLVAFGCAVLAASWGVAGALGVATSAPRAHFWREVRQSGWIAPEPDLARFLVAAAVPVVLAASLALSPDRLRRLGRSAVGRAAGLAGPVAVLVVVAVAWQRRAEPLSYGYGREYFSRAELLLAVLVASLVALVARAWDRVGRGWRRIGVAAGPRRWVLGWCVAAFATALLLSPAAYPGGTLAGALEVTRVHVPYTMADFAAFGNGATPLADFAAQYSNLLPWVAHPLLAAFDYTPGAFTVTMTVLSALALLALWRTLVLVARSEARGLLLYLPVLALSVRPGITSGDERATNATLYQILPERYVLPCLLAWLCARHLRGLAPRRPAVLFVVGALAALNNPEFGVPAFLAAAAALALGRSAPMPRPVAIRYLRDAIVGGLAATLAVVVAVTVRSGGPPDPSLLTYYSRLFGTQGFGLQPMPDLGLHVVVYATFVGSLLLAAARLRWGEPDGATTGLHAFAGMFGLGAIGYYAGRSNAISMVALFPAWAIALALLTLTSLRSLAASRAGGRTRLAPIAPLAALALVGFGLAVTDLVDPPLPGAVLRRLRDDSGPAGPDVVRASRFVAARAGHGEHVLVIRENGHLIALRAGVRNVSPVGDPFHVASSESLDALVAALGHSGGTRIYEGDGRFLKLWRGIRLRLRAHGWRPTAKDPITGVTEWRRR